MRAGPVISSKERYSEAASIEYGTFLAVTLRTVERQFRVRCATQRALDFQLVNNDDDCVIVQSAEHAARPSLSLRTGRIADGRALSAWQGCELPRPVN